MKYSSFCILLLMINAMANPLRSQNFGDTLHLREVEIKTTFYSTNNGFKRIKIDSSILLPKLNCDLATILAENSTIFIKSYGNGGLATASFRGTTANHTQVQWNGVNINSPMLGQTDFSQIPVGQFDNIEILYGPAGIAFTSGAFGGLVNLVTKPDWDNRINLLIAPTISSFHTYGGNLKFSVGNVNFQSITRANYNSSKNDFPYYDNKLQIRHQQNASYYKYGITEELYWRPTSKDIISLKTWYNEGFNNLPPNLTSINVLNGESISETVLRSIAEWKKSARVVSFVLRSDYINENMNYRNDSAGINDHHIYNSFINRWRGIISGTSKLKIKPGVDLNYEWVSSDAYNGLKTRNNISLFSEFIYEFNRKIQATFVGREELIDGKFMPFIAAIGMNYKPFPIDLAFSVNFSRNYRFPTLNELYWKSFGNPNLKPEKDHAAEVGVIYRY
ncbi:MAG: TonB-dependent receptor, partial [Bacteroidota bacterium]